MLVWCIAEKEGKGFKVIGKGDKTSFTEMG